MPGGTGNFFSNSALMLMLSLPLVVSRQGQLCSLTFLLRTESLKDLQHGIAPDNVMVINDGHLADTAHQGSQSVEIELPGSAFRLLLDSLWIGSATLYSPTDLQPIADFLVSGHSVVGDGFWRNGPAPNAGLDVF